jgi:hypothetical protein
MPQLPRPRVYNLPVARIEDDNNGGIKIKLNSSEHRGIYELRTKPFDGCKSFKPNSLLMLGCYSEFFYEDNPFLAELAKIIFGW